MFEEVSVGSLASQWSSIAVHATTAYCWSPPHVTEPPSYPAAQLCAHVAAMSVPSHPSVAMACMFEEVSVGSLASQWSSIAVQATTAYWPLLPHVTEPPSYP